MAKGEEPEVGVIGFDPGAPGGSETFLSWKRPGDGRDEYWKLPPGEPLERLRSELEEFQKHLSREIWKHTLSDLAGIGLERNLISSEPEFRAKWNEWAERAGRGWGMSKERTEKAERDSEVERILSERILSERTGVWDKPAKPRPRPICEVSNPLARPSPTAGMSLRDLSPFFTTPVS